MSQTDRFPYKEQMMDLMEEISGQMYIPQLVQHFDKSMIFDTTEKIVGKWIDGRPLYQKSADFTLSNLGGSTSSYRTQNLISTTTFMPNYKDVVDIKGCINWTSGGKTGLVPLSMYGPTAEECAIYPQIDPNGNMLQVHGYGDWSGSTLHLTLQYTKTTDAAGSYNIADENDYSTTEKIVGTWIDGKPVYQKTIIIPPSQMPQVTTDDVRVYVDLDIGLTQNNENVISIKALRVPTTSSNNRRTIPAIADDGKIALNLYIKTNNALTIESWKTSNNIVSIVITLQYTKTTD